MKKINIGCGLNLLQGWENYDLYPANPSVKFLDMTHPLPFENNSVEYILNEHCVEHITMREGYNFFKECKRILKPGGVLRTATPSLTQIAYGENDNYIKFLKDRGWGDGTVGSGIKCIIFEHGHQCVYSVEGLIAILYSLGFKAQQVPVGNSEFSELRGIEGHNYIIGDEINLLETFCVEAQKPA